MSREIKYQVFHKGRMGQCLRLSLNGSGVFAATVDFGDGTSEDILDPVLRQFIGYSDKNDVEIYDRDIARTFRRGGDEELVGVIAQQSPTMWFFQGFKDFAETSKQGDSHKDTFCYGTIDEALFHFGKAPEIIGNIHETPELLTPSHHSTDSTGE